MKRQAVSRIVLACSLLLLGLLTAPGGAQPPRGMALFGDWQVKVPFGERQIDVIWSFSRTPEQDWTGQWIGWTMNELKDVTFEDGKLSFAHTARWGDNEYTSTFKGTVEDGTLAGVLSGERGDSNITGQRRRRTPRAVGTWDMNFKIGDRDITTQLVVTADKEGRLKAEWKSPWGEHTITDVVAERRNFSFKRKSTFQERQMESTFEGTFEGDTLVGTMKSEMGDIEVRGTRVGAAVIGRWNLNITTDDWGPFQQRLVVYPDMTGLYGPLPIEKVELKDDQVSFHKVIPFGDQDFTMDFAGKLADGKLTGEMATSRGTQQITGTKIVRFRRGRPNR